MDGEKQGSSEDNINISFSGCGFLGIYHIGVIQCLREKAPSLIPKFSVVAGASAGAIASLVLLSNCPAERVCKGFIDTSEMSRKHWIGPLSTSFDIMAVLNALFDDLLPPHAHRLCNGRLQISLTAVPEMKNYMATHFNTRMELIKALKATCYIPVWAGIARHSYRGKTYMDGGVTNNLPTDFPGETITVSPFSGEADICPRDQREGWDMSFYISGTSVRMTLANAFRLKSALFPPDPATLERMYQGGYRDCLRFLRQRGWIESSAVSPTNALNVVMPRMVEPEPTPTMQADQKHTRGHTIFAMPRLYLHEARELLTGMYSVLMELMSNSYAKAVTPSLMFMLVAAETVVRSLPKSCAAYYLAGAQRTSASSSRHLQAVSSSSHGDSGAILPSDLLFLEAHTFGAMISTVSKDSGYSGTCTPGSPGSLSSFPSCLSAGEELEEDAPELMAEE